jgi:hypothetical protein
LVADGWKLNRTTSLLVTRSSAVASILAINRRCSSSSALLVLLALILFLLLAGLPLLSDLLEFCKEAWVSWRSKLRSSYSSMSGLVKSHQDFRSSGYTHASLKASEVIPSSK